MSAIYINSELYDTIICILNRKKVRYAWTRYLGFRMIEEFSLVIDGEEIDSYNSDLLLLLYRIHWKNQW